MSELSTTITTFLAMREVDLKGNVDDLMTLLNREQQKIEDAARRAALEEARKAIEHLGVGEKTENQEQAKGFTNANLIAVIRIDKLLEAK